MRFTLRERMSLFRLALMGFGRLPETILKDQLMLSVARLATGASQKPTNSSSSGLPAIGREPDFSGLHTPLACPEVLNSANKPYLRGEMMDGDEGE